MIKQQLEEIQNDTIRSLDLSAKEEENSLNINNDS